MIKSPVLKVFFRTMSVLLVVIILIGSILFAKMYIREIKEGFNYKGQHYTFVNEYDLISDDDNTFLPFGSKYCDFFDDLRFKKYFFLEYYEEDTEKLFFYDFTPFGNSIYKKDSYEITNTPEPDKIDFLKIEYGTQIAYIRNKNDIEKIVSYFNDINSNAPSKSTASSNGFNMEIYASSKEYSGMFMLTHNYSLYMNPEDGKITFTVLDYEIPQEVSDILIAYYSSSTKY